MRVSVLTALLLAAACARSETIVVGSKNFAENYVLAEIAAQLLEHHDYDVERRLGLNGTKIVFEALSNRAVDLYPEEDSEIPGT